MTTYTENYKEMVRLTLLTPKRSTNLKCQDHAYKREDSSNIRGDEEFNDVKWKEVLIIALD